MNQPKQKAASLPAYPPQLLQDNFGRLIAPVPGMNLREAVALAVLPALINSDGGGIVCEDVAIAFCYADEFCARVDRDAEATGDTLQIVP